MVIKRGPSAQTSFSSEAFLTYGSTTRYLDRSLGAAVHRALRKPLPRQTGLTLVQRADTLPVEDSPMTAEQARKLSKESRETVSKHLLNDILSVIRAAAEEGKESTTYRFAKAHPDAVVDSAKRALTEKGFVVAHIKPGSAVSEHGNFNLGWKE